MQRQILINVMIFFAYALNLPLNTQRPHHRSQRARKLGLDFGSWQSPDISRSHFYRGTFPWTPPTAIYRAYTVLGRSQLSNPSDLPCFYFIPVINNLQCGAVILCQFSPKSSQEAPHSSPISVSYGVPVVSLISILCFAWITAYCRVYHVILRAL